MFSGTSNLYSCFRNPPDRTGVEIEVPVVKTSGSGRFVEPALKVPWIDGGKSHVVSWVDSLR
jgi:hypothetical protein